MNPLYQRNTSFRARFEEALDNLPVFPLPNVTLFPGARLALHVFEPRYRAMLAHCLEGHGCMAVALIRPQAGQSPYHPELAPVAGVGVIVQHEPLRDGRSNIVLEGIARVRLEEKPFTPPFRLARADVIDDLPGEADSTDMASLVLLASQFAAAIRAGNAQFDLSIPKDAEGGEFADILAQELVIDPRDRQLLLETREPVKRVHALLRILAAQWEALRPREQSRVCH